MENKNRQIRILVSKVGLDGHDRGIKVIAYALRDAGMEVIYTDLHQTPDQVALAALQEGVDIVGLSILSGSHLSLCKRVWEKMSEYGCSEIPIVLGGVIPETDIPILEKMGIKKVFLPGTSLQVIVEAIRKLVMTSSKLSVS